MDKFVVRKSKQKYDYKSIAAESMVNITNSNTNADSASLPDEKSPKANKLASNRTYQNVKRTPMKEIYTTRHQSQSFNVYENSIDFKSPILSSTRTSFANHTGNNKKTKSNEREERKKHKDMATNVSDTPNEELLEENNEYRLNDDINNTPAAGVLAPPLRERIMAQIRRDYNSPSAALRVRAMRALNCPDKCDYGIFDISHSEQNIIGAEERQEAVTALAQTPTIQQIMSNVVVYVEVRSGEENRSSGVKKVIATLGAQVNDRLLRNTTHVIFKNGLLSTFRKARDWSIPVVSILWIEACKNQRRLCNTADFPISNLDQYENPELYPKLPRIRNMQPDAESRRVRTPKSTTSTIKTPKKTNRMPKTPASQKNTLKNFITEFMLSTPGTGKTPKPSQVESPATQYLNRNTEENCTPLKQALANQINLGKIQEQKPAEEQHHIDSNVAELIENKSKDFDTQSAGDCGKVNKKLDFESVADNISIDKSIENIANVTPKARGKRRRIADSIGPNPLIEDFSNRRLTRRSSLQSLQSNMPVEKIGATEATTIAPSATIAAVVDLPLKATTISTSTQTDDNNVAHIIYPSPSQQKNFTVKKIASFQAIPEGDSEQQAPKSNATNYEQEIFSVSDLSKGVEPSKINSKRRQTVYAAENMEMTSIAERVEEKSEEYFDATDNSDDTAASRLGPPIFSSTRLPASPQKGGSIYDITLEIINQRLININDNSRRRSVAAAAAEAVDAGPLQCNNESTSTTAPPEEDAPEVSSATAAAVQNSNNENEIKSDSSDTLVSKQSLEKVSKKRKLYPPCEEIAEPPTVKEFYVPLLGKRRRRRQLVLKTPGAIPCRKAESILQSASTIAAVEAETAPITPLDRLMKGASRRSSLYFEKQPPPKPRPEDELIENLPLKNTSRPKRACMVYTNMHSDQVAAIVKACRKLGHFRIDYTVSERTTHIVSLEPRRTLNLLRALMRGIWILQYRWVLDSVREGVWLYEEPYEMKSFSRSVEICRTERQAFGRDYCCELFRHMDTFYVSSRCCLIAAIHVKELLLLGHADLTEHRMMAKYVIGDKRREIDDRIYLSPLWVLDSITTMQIQKFAKYLMGSTVVSDAAALTMNAPLPTTVTTYQPYQSYCVEGHLPPTPYV